MTVWHEYLDQATFYITDPHRANAVRRELQMHLEETAEALQAVGLDPTAAIAVAVARMGAPESIALGLGEAHHRHLPWRLYLAPVFLGCVIFCLWWWSDTRALQLAARWLPFLGISLWPDRTRWVHPLRLLRVDICAKWHWLRWQMWDRALVTGAATGCVAGLIWGVLPHLLKTGLADYMVIYPLSAALLVAWVERRLLPCPALLTASVAALTFPLAYLPGYFRWWPPAHDWPFMTAFFAICFGLVALSAGWLAQMAAEKRVS